MSEKKLKIFVTNLKNFLTKNLKKKNPIVIYSSIWQPCIQLEINPIEFSNELIKIFINFSKKNSILMPSFTKSKKNIICLDKEPSTSGFLTKKFLEKKEVARTICPIFSHAVLGKEYSSLNKLNYEEIWGKGSLYEYLYKKNCYILTIGTHPTECALSHYAEWLCKDKLSYRKIKKKKFRITYKKKSFKLDKILFVRKKNIKYDFKKLYKSELQNGMTVKKINNITLSLTTAQNKINLIKKKLDKDPDYFL